MDRYPMLPRSEHNWWKWRCCIWLFCAAVIAAFLGEKAILHRQFVQANSRENQRLTTAAQAAAPTGAAVQKLRTETIDEVKTEFRAYGPFVETQYNDIARSIEFTEPASGYHFRVNFMMGHVLSTKSSPIQAIAFDDHAWKAFRDFAAKTARFGAVFWIALLLLSLDMPLRRRRVAEGLFGIALICVACWAVDGRLARWIEFKSDFFSVAIAAAMLMTSIVLIVLPPRRAWAHSNCRKCDYDLTGNLSGICPECGEPTPHAVACVGEIARKLSAMQKPVDSVEG